MRQGGPGLVAGQAEAQVARLLEVGLCFLRFARFLELLTHVVAALAVVLGAGVLQRAVLVAAADQRRAQPAKAETAGKPQDTKDPDLAAPTVLGPAKEALATLAIANLQTGNRISIGLKDSVQGLANVTSWTL